MKAKSKECVQKLEASEKRKTKENTILITGHKDEMSKLVKICEKELHVHTIVLCVPLAHIGFIFACLTLTLFINVISGLLMESRKAGRKCTVDLKVSEKKREWNCLSNRWR